ncbi:MAG TPA: multiheme c-type cytochrome [Acidobacteriaceae bacterium]
MSVAVAPLSICQQQNPQPTAAQLPSPPAPASQAAQTASLHTPSPASAWAGDAACAECHAAEAKTYFATTHYSDSSPASQKTILGDFTTGKNVLRTSNPNLIFAMIAAPDGFYQSAVNISDPQHLTGDAEKFDIVVGSGRHGQSYLYWKGDDLFELPVSYWTYTHEWINSPGYVDGRADFQRPVEPRCLECHATTFQSTAPPSNRFDPRSLVLGIGCETCHGPGAAHVAIERSAHPPAAGSSQIAIVNPARLSRDRQMDVCGLCHASPGVPIAPSLSFRPGDDLARYVKITPPPPGAPVDVHGNQVNALERSKCFSSGKLTCSTCHNVHRSQESAASFSAHCLGCHSVHACPRFQQLGESIRTRCVECHMPVGKSTAITSGLEGRLLQAKMRTHRIAIYPDAGPN